jgi:hypothetical protein
MDLENRTPAPARVFLFADDEPMRRRGMVVAKATLRIGEAGEVTLDRDDPLPILRADQQTELGLLPRDDLPLPGDDFQVITLGQARAPEGASVPSMRVELAVGEVRRQLWVYGDRWWQQDGTPTRPQPFSAMPLTWERAFGGTCEVELDREAPLDVAWPLNPQGRGFDPGPAADGLARQLGAPEAYPRVPGPRPLPNVEHPQAPIEHPEDTPLPAGWATLPLGSGIWALKAMGVDPAAAMTPGSGQQLPGEHTPGPARMYRAHPDWVIPQPPAMAAVELVGLTPEGWLSFRLPRLRVLADYCLGGRHGTRELRPRVLLLLPEERRLALIYQHLFSLTFRPAEERAMRLRLEQGWWLPTEHRRP